MGKKVKEKALRKGGDQWSLELSAKTSQKPQNLNMAFGAKKEQVLGGEKGQQTCQREFQVV